MLSFGKAADSGFADQIGCERCGGTMTIIRRTPHPESGPGHELQTLGCRECTELANRSIDEEGQLKPGGVARYTGL
jgi:hypothetical protein